MKNYLSLCVCALLFVVGNALNAQSLEAVLSSIQERRWVVEQRDDAEFALNLAINAPVFDKITWEGLTEDFPAEESLVDASIETRVKLLNQAVKEFDKLKGYYLNVDPLRLQSTPNIKEPALLDAFDELSLPSPGRVTSQNYHKVLQSLARSVSKLRVLTWVGRFYVSDYEAWFGDNVGSQGAGSISNQGLVNIHGANEYQYPGNPFDLGAIYDSTRAVELWRVDGSSGSASTSYSFTSQYAKRVTVKHHEDSPSGYVVAGTSMLLRKQDYTPAVINMSIDGDTELAKDGRHKVMGSTTQNGDIAIAQNAPVIECNGSWDLASANGGAPGGSADFRQFQPDGIDTIFIEDDKADYAQLGTSTYYQDYSGHGVICMSRSYSMIYVPGFTKGLDAGYQATLQHTAKLPAPGLSLTGTESVDGSTVKWSLHSGVGNTDRQTLGALIIAHPSYGKSALIKDEQAEFYRRDPSDLPLFGFNSHLRFAGVDGDFQCIYETRYDKQRDDIGEWTGAEAHKLHKGWQGVGAYIEAWQRPRLRQVLGHRVLIDIVKGANDYAQTIIVYRRPTNHTPQYDADGFIETTGLVAWKTIKTSSPGTVTDGFTSQPEKLDIHTVGERRVEIEAQHIEVAKTEVEAGPLGPVNVDYKKVLYPDWTIRVKGDAGGATLAQREWTATHEYEAPLLWHMETLMVTNQTDGQNSGTIKYTFSTDDEETPIYDPLARVLTTTLNPGANEVLTTYTYPATGVASWGVRWPKKIVTADPLGADSSIEWDNSGLLLKTESGDTDKWVTDWSVEAAGLFKAVSKYKGNTYATTWTEWKHKEGSEPTSKDQILTYSAPDGTITTSDNDANSITTVELYPAMETTSIAWMVKQVTNRDGTGSTHDYTLAADGSLTVETKSGLLNGNSISKGIKTTRVSNARGYPVSVTSTDIVSNTQLSGTTYGGTTTWGAPTTATDYTTKLVRRWEYKSNTDLKKSTDALGVVTDSYTYDGLNRLTGYAWDGKTGTVEYNKNGANNNERGISHMLDFGAGVGDRGYTRSWDILGNTTGGSTAAGVGSSYDISDTASSRTIDFNNDFNDSYKQTLRKADGTLDNTDDAGTNVAFATAGDGLTVDGGLFKIVQRTKARGAGNDSTVWKDAWGRVRKTETPDTDGNLSTTTISYSNPADLLKRSTVTEALPAGHSVPPRSISESQAYFANNNNDSVSRSGIDMNNDGVLTLAGGDIYSESITTVGAVTVDTVTSATSEDQNGTISLRPVHSSSYNPATGETEDKTNGSEETITSTPDYANKKVEIASNRGLDIQVDYNKFGQLTKSDASGSTGMPGFISKMEYHPDGSPDKSTLSSDGTADGTGDNVIGWGINGLLDTLETPQRGALGVSHTRSDGGSIVTIDDTIINSGGVNNTTKAVTNSRTGDGVWNRTRTTTLGNNGNTETLDPGTGSSTVLTTNIAGAKTGHDYVAGADLSQSWLKGGLMNSFSIGRKVNGVTQTVQLTYHDNGAKQLKSITYPDMDGSSGHTPANEAYTWNQAGLPKTIDDESGKRTYKYWRERLKNVDYSPGAISNGNFLDPVELVYSYDPTTGRKTGVTVRWNNNDVVNLGYIYTQSGGNNTGELASVQLSNSNVATYSRDPNSRLVTAVDRPQADTTYFRDLAKGGRLTKVTNGMANAPNFENIIYDNKGRLWKIDCKQGASSQGTTTYSYDNASGQLTQAENIQLGDFSYTLDGIGRRSDPNYAANTTDPLNQFKGISHTADKKLHIAALPAARLWVNGVEQVPFNGSFSYTLGSPGAVGVWVPWHVEGVLEGAGDPGAGPDAKSEFSGVAWIPPAQEAFVYDADGNRESSAHWTYTWDGRNRLVGAKTKDYATADQGTEVSFKYDSQGRRVYKDVTQKTTVNNQAQYTTTKQYFVWDDWNLVYERHENSQGGLLLERKYAWGLDASSSSFGAGGAGGLVAYTEVSGGQSETYYPLYTPGGHVAGLADNSGTLVAEYWWGPFGELISSTGPKAASNPWRYATKYYDVETGLHYFGHRYFDSTTGQWLSREPLGEDESLNLYAYCHNDPVNKVDILGLMEQSQVPHTDFLVTAGAIDGFARSGIMRTIPRNGQEAHQMVTQFLSLIGQTHKLTFSDANLRFSGGADQQRVRNRIDALIGASSSLHRQLEIYSHFADGEGNLPDALLNSTSWVNQRNPVKTRTEVYFGPPSDMSVLMYPPAVKFMAGEAVYSEVEGHLQNNTNSSMTAFGATKIIASMRNLKNLPIKVVGATSQGGKLTSDVFPNAANTGSKRSFGNWLSGVDRGGAFYTDKVGQSYSALQKIPVLRRLKKYQGRIENDDVIHGSPLYAKIDTQVHEGFHALVGNHLPSYSRLTYKSYKGFQYGRVFWHLEETAAYGLGRLSSGRLHLLPLAPLEAFSGFGKAGVRDALIGYGILGGAGYGTYELFND